MTGRPESSGRLVVALGVIVSALAMLNWHVAYAPVDISPIVPDVGRVEDPPKKSGALLTSLDKKPLLQFRETVNRPLFTPDRKPVQRNRPETKETAAGLGDMRLIGVMKLDSGPGRALIRLTKDTTGKWIAEGEQFDGWKLRQVTAGSVIVEAGGRSHELVLQSGRQPTDDPPEANPGTQPR